MWYILMFFVVLLNGCSSFQNTESLIEMDGAWVSKDVDSFSSNLILKERKIIFNRDHFQYVCLQNDVEQVSVQGTVNITYQHEQVEFAFKTEESTNILIGSVTPTQLMFVFNNNKRLAIPILFTKQ
ncbi:MAG: hypothetical protein ACRCTQ_01530 [Brevinemataceae bacterium]